MGYAPPIVRVQGCWGGACDPTEDVGIGSLNSRPRTLGRIARSGRPGGWCRRNGRQTHHSRSAPADILSPQLVGAASQMVCI